MNLQFNSKNNINGAHAEVVYTDSKKVSCDGGKGTLEHPLVYLNMGKNNSVVCPYCSKYFTVESRNSSNSVIVGIKNQNQ